MQQDNIIIADLLQAAREVRRYSQSKYSHYAVGAALRSKDGRIFRGTNVESSSYGLSICAERVALFTALSAGVTEFTYLAVVTENTPPATPCGACRQLIWDFAREVKILLSGPDGGMVVSSIADLLPDPFGSSNFKESEP